MAVTEIVLFESSDGAVSLPVEVDAVRNEVWLTQAQMALLFDTTKQNVSLHLGNCFKEGELEREAVVKESLTTASDGKRYQTNVYSLDAIISVGYRVKSQRGVEFRRWATDVLHRFIIDGYAANERRLHELGQVVSVMARLPEGDMGTRQVLDIVRSYAPALDLLDDYDASPSVGRRAARASTSSRTRSAARSSRT